VSRLQDEKNEDGKEGLKEGKRVLKFGPYSFEASNLDKVFFPDSGIRKGDVLDYYLDVAETMIRHTKDRPLVMRRFPDGIEGHDFYQQDMPDYFPDWVERVKVKKQGGTVTHVLCQNRATLAYLADQACLTPHVWLSRAGDVYHPDRLLFDLDPPGDSFEPVREAAMRLKDILEELDMQAFVQTTGSKGVHMVVALDGSARFDEARHFARDLCGVLAARHNESLTVEQRKDKRQGRVYLDFLRNSYGQSMVAPYALRVLPGAPAATPLEWDELRDRKIGPRSYGLKDIPRRLAQMEDPWAALSSHGVKLSSRQQRLDDMLEGTKKARD